MTKMLPRWADPSKEILKGTGVIKEEVVAAIEHRRHLLADSFVDEEDRGGAGWSFHPDFATSIIHLLVVVGFSVVVHASHFAFFVGFVIDIALDGDRLGLHEYECVDLLSDFEGELLKVASLGREAGRELIGHVWIVVRVVTVVLQWREVPDVSKRRAFDDEVELLLDSGRDLSSV